VHLSHKVLRSHVKWISFQVPLVTALSYPREIRVLGHLIHWRVQQVIRGDPYTDRETQDFESRSLFRFVITILPGIGSFGRAYDSSANIEYGGIHAECRVLAEWCADYNCRRLDDDRRRPRTSTIQPATSGGLTFTGGTCVSWDPEGGPYLSDCVDGGPTETRHPWLSISHLTAPADNLRRKVYLLVKDESR